MFLFSLQFSATLINAPRPHIQTFGLWVVNVLYWRKYLWHCWDFSGPPAVAVIGRPHSNSAPVELCRPCPPRYAHARNTIASYWSQTSTLENLRTKPFQVETLALNGGWHAWTTPATLMRFFDLFYEVFPKRKYIFFETKMFVFRKHFRNESVSETKVKLVLILKRKDFNLQTKVKVFPIRNKSFEIENVLIWIYLPNESVFEPKVKSF